MLRQDSTFALRMMRKNLGFTIAAISVLGWASAPTRHLSASSTRCSSSRFPLPTWRAPADDAQSTPTSGLMVATSPSTELMDYRRQIAASTAHRRKPQHAVHPPRPRLTRAGRKPASFLELFSTSFGAKP